MMMMIDPNDMTSSSQSINDMFILASAAVADTTDVSSAVAEKDYGEVAKSILIALAFGGGLIPAAIGANSAMISTLSGKPQVDEVSTKSREELQQILREGKSLDPTILETKYRQYVADSGATGPTLPGSFLLFASEKIPTADIVAVLGRISDVDSIVDWSNLPSTKLPNVSKTDPPMYLPRRAFKVYIRKAKFLGWPNDPKTGLPVGGEALKEAELGRISKKDALISDAALDAVFDSWSWGAAIATPDKVQQTLAIYKNKNGVVGSLDLNEFIGAAIRGRSTTAFAAAFFVLIQFLAYTSLFIAPAMRFFFDIDIGFGKLGA